MTEKYKKTARGEVECFNCDFEGVVKVVTDTMAAVSCFECPECGQAQEP